jgi:hypothetical protein
MSDDAYNDDAYDAYGDDDYKEDFLLIIICIVIAMGGLLFCSCIKDLLTNIMCKREI